MTSKASRALETFPNPRPGRTYEVRFECEEFTCVCPKTGLPDFASFVIEYEPDEVCVERVSLGKYLASYRDERYMHEALTNQVFDDLMEVLSPTRLRVEGEFHERGGIETIVEVESDDDDDEDDDD